jgi:hypothetical protein
VLPPTTIADAEGSREITVPSMVATEPGYIVMPPGRTIALPGIVTGMIEKALPPAVIAGNPDTAGIEIVFPFITAIAPEGATEYILPSTSVADAGNKVSPLGRTKPV